jgi:2-oxoisovalerate dehydrogenase E1 component
VLQILDENAELVGELPDLSDERLLELHTTMVLARTLDRKLANMSIQGRIAAYYKIEGQEAHTAAGFALRPQDFVFPAYREMGIWLTKGLPIDAVLRFWMDASDHEWNTLDLNLAQCTATIGTHIPHATGYGYAARCLGRDQVALSVFSDGATSTPDFHASLNFAGVWKAPVVFLCQNNQWAEETPVWRQTASETLAQKADAYGFAGVKVDGMDPLAMYQATRDAVERARAGEGPTLIEMLTYRYSPHMVAALDPRPEEEQAYWKARDPLPRFEKFLMGRGVLSEASSEQIQAEASEQVEASVTRIADVVAEEGMPAADRAVRNVFERIPRSLAEQVQTRQRWSGEPQTEFGEEELWPQQEDVLPGGPREKWCIREALNAALHHAMAERSETIVLGEDVALVGGQFRVTEGLLEKYGEERVIDTPLCELGILGTSVGMAIAGARPVPEVMFSGFVYTALDNIVGHVSRVRFRYHGKLSVPIVIRTACGTGVGAHEFHVDAPEAVFSHIPGLTVIYPSNATDAKGLLSAALESEDPVVFMEPLLLYNAPSEQVPVDYYALPIGKAKVCQPGSDVTLVAYGPVVHAARKAARQSSASVEVIDLRTLYPWDEQTVLESVSKTGRLVVASETPRTCGYAAEIAATVAEKAIYALQAPPIRVAGFDAPRLTRKLEQRVNIGASQLLGAIDDALSS